MPSLVLKAAPIGCLVGGLFMGIPFGSVLRNLLPICGVAFLLILGLLLCPARVIRCFYTFNRFLGIITVCGLVIGGLEYMTGYSILPGTIPILEALVVPGRIAVMLMGCLPFMKLISKLLNRVLEPLGKKVGVNGRTLEALLLTTATAIPIFTMLRDMPPKGKTAAAAWMVGVMGLLTAHLGFAMGVDPAVCQPQMVAKLVSGVISLTAALLIPKDSTFYRQEALDAKEQREKSSTGQI